MPDTSAWKPVEDTGAWKPVAEASPEQRGFWSSFIGKPEDFTNSVSALGRMVRHPLDTLSGMGQQTIDLGKQAASDIGSGNITRGVRRGVNAGINLIAPGMGVASEHAGQQFDAGNTAGGFGETAALGTATALGLKTPQVVQGIPKVAAQVKPLANATGQAVKAAAPGIAKGGAMIAGGELLGKVPGMEWPARIGMGYPGVRQLGKAFKSGGKAFEESLHPPAAATVAASPAEALATADGKVFSKLSPDQRQLYTDIARAQENAKAQGGAGAPRTPAPAVSPRPNPRPPQEEIAPITTPALPADPPLTRAPVGGGPLRPPIAGTQAPPPQPAGVNARAAPEAKVAAAKALNERLQTTRIINEPGQALNAEPASPATPTPNPQPPSEVAPITAKPTPEEMAAPFKGEPEVTVAARNQSALVGAGRHMGNRISVVEEMADKINSNTLTGQKLPDGRWTGDMGKFMDLDVATRQAIAKRVAAMSNK